MKQTKISARHLSSICWIAIAAIVAIAFVTQAEPARADYKITILHINDVLSRLEPVDHNGVPCPIEVRFSTNCIGGAPRLASVIKTAREQSSNVLLLDAGGEFTGSPLWDRQKERAIATVMTRLGVDAMGVGFPEFSEGSSVLGQFIHEVRFPLLSANVNVERDPYLVDQIWPFVVIDRGGDRIGLIGYSSEDIRSRSHPSAETRIDPIENSVKFAVRMVKSMGITKIIAVSYAGYARDKQIAETVEDIDIIVGGNSHTLLANSKMKEADGPYPTVIKGPTKKPVLVVQAGAYGQYVGKLDVVFDAKGVVKSWKGEPILLDVGVTEDAEMRAALEVMEAGAQQAAVVGAGTVR